MYRYLAGFSLLLFACSAFIAAMGGESPVWVITTQYATTTFETPPEGQNVYLPKEAGLHMACKNYPVGAIRTGKTGDTTVSYRVSKAGGVENIKVAQSSGSESLDESAVSCVEKWSFVPAMQNGVPIDYLGRTTIKWRIHKDPNTSYDHGALVRDDHEATACISDYPTTAREAGSEGTTVMSFVIDAEGKMKNLAVATSSGNASLDAASQRCTSLLVYKPAAKDGAAIESAVRRSVVWKLTASPFRAIVENRPLPCSRFLSRYPDDPNWREGTTVLTFTVEDGKARNFKVVQSGGNRRIDDASIECVKIWNFAKVLKDGEPVAIRDTVSILWKRPTPGTDAMPTTNSQ